MDCTLRLQEQFTTIKWQKIASLYCKYIGDTLILKHTKRQSKMIGRVMSWKQWALLSCLVKVILDRIDFQVEEYYYRKRGRSCEKEPQVTSEATSDRIERGSRLITKYCWRFWFSQLTDRIYKLKNQWGCAGSESCCQPARPVCYLQSASSSSVEHCQWFQPLGSKSSL